MSSTLWIAVIALGALLVALGNINYNRARDQERASAASAKALSMLKVEASNNLRRIQEMRTALIASQVNIAAFEDTAWKIVSEGGLLAQVDQPTMARIADVYYRIGLLNTYHSRLLELSVGVSSALGQSQQFRKQLIGAMQDAMKDVEPMLATLAGQ